MSAEQPATTADAHLHCPTCDYDLTGLPESRCPECGNAFDRELLLRRLSDQPVPCTPWDADPSGPFLRRFARTWWLAFFDPRKLAKEFPHRHPAALACGFSIACYALAAFMVIGTVALYAIALGPDRFLEIVTGTMFVVGGIIVICWLCEAVLAGVITFVAPDVRPLRHYHFWRGLTHYTSGYTLLSAGAFVCIMGLAPFLRSSSSVGPLAIWLLIIGAFYVWARALCVMIAVRFPAGFRRIAACVMVPIIGFLAIIAGVVVVGIFALVS